MPAYRFSISATSEGGNGALRVPSGERRVQSSCGPARTDFLFHRRILKMAHFRLARTTRPTATLGQQSPEWCRDDAVAERVPPEIVVRRKETSAAVSHAAPCSSVRQCAPSTVHGATCSCAIPNGERSGPPQRPKPADLRSLGCTGIETGAARCVTPGRSSLLTRRDRSCKLSSLAARLLPAAGPVGIRKSAATARPV